MYNYSEIFNAELAFICTCSRASDMFSYSANILVTVDWRGMLGDFGVARSLPSSEHTSLHTSTVVGTRVYMAHEFSQGTISPATDTYALGVVSIHYMYIQLLFCDK